MAQKTVEKSTTTRQTLDDPPSKLQGAESDPSRIDTVFSVLQNARRRRILRYLDAEGTSTIGELATHIAALENGIEERAVTSDQRKLVYVSLYQSHLTKLDEAGCVSYDPDRGTVEPTSEIDRYLALLDRFAETDVTQPRQRGIYSLGGAGLLGVVLALVVLPIGNVVPATLVSALAVVTAVGALVLIGLSLRH